MKPIKGLIFLILLSVVGYIAYQWNKIKQYKVVFLKYDIISATENNILSEITLNVSNPSDIDLTVDGYDFDFLINNKFVSKVKASNKQLIKAHANSNFTIALDFNPSNVLGTVLDLSFLSNLIKNKSNVLLGLKGSLTIFGIFNIPLDIEQPLSDIA